MITDDRHPDFDGGGAEAEAMAEDQISRDTYIRKLRLEQRALVASLADSILMYPRSDWRADIIHVLHLEQQICDANRPLPSDK